MEVLDSYAFLSYSSKNINNIVQNKYSFNKSTCGIIEKIGISYKH
ncbi:hypothetical protein S3E15_01435 [Bacillus mycoides]|uniref:Uncharacterized protein n=1 Tax=Bacillus mycoides TaxID=1405 RepID=A0AAP8BD26_BACMY|nr:hypothetical protein B4117_4706 [Bacillus mycoides]OSX90807.1 hypothetical protein S3E15_01435 [Bacillus mycoides]